MSHGKEYTVKIWSEIRETLLLDLNLFCLLVLLHKFRDISLSLLLLFFYFLNIIFLKEHSDKNLDDWSEEIKRVGQYIIVSSQVYLYNKHNYVLIIYLPIAIILWSLSRPFKVRRNHYDMNTSTSIYTHIFLMDNKEYLQDITKY